MRKDTSEAVRRSLADYERSGDRTVILAAEARARALELRQQVGWPMFGPVPDNRELRRNAQQIALAGRFFWERARAAGTGEGLQDLLHAVELFAGLARQVPDRIPQQLLRRCLVLADGLPVAERMDMHDRALDLLETAGITRDAHQFDQAIELLFTAAFSARGEADEPYYLSQLGRAWLNRFRNAGRTADIDNAVQASSRAARLVVPEDEDQAGHLAIYADAIMTRYEHEGKDADLDLAVSISREAATRARRARQEILAGDIDGLGRERAPKVDLALAVSLSGLATALMRLSDARRNSAALGEAVRTAREAVDAVQVRNPTSLRVKAMILLEQFSRTWLSVDLSEAMDAALEAVALMEAGPQDPAYVPCLEMLANAYRFQALHSGDLRDLDNAIAVGRDALLHAVDHDAELACRDGLGLSLRLRYSRTGDTGALTEAITLLADAVTAMDPGDVARHVYLNHLGTALRDRFTEQDDPSDITAAVTWLEIALSAIPKDHADRCMTAANLAIALVSKFARTGDDAALDNAIRVVRQELPAAGAGHPMRAPLLAAEGLAWRCRYDALGDDESLDNAIAAFDAAAVAGHDDPHQAEYLSNLGGVLASRVVRGNGREAGEKAIDACKRAVAGAGLPTWQAADAARTWGRVAALQEDVAESLAGHAEAVRLLDAVAWRGLDRKDQQRQLSRFFSLACDAAAQALQAGEDERAVELLEQGRGVILAQLIDERYRYHDLEIAAPKMARQLADLDGEIDRIASSGDLLRLSRKSQIQRRDDLAGQREELLRRIRSLPGWKAFLQTPSFADLQAAAFRGPVVIINVSSYRCDALIVTTSGVEAIKLPDLDLTDLIKRVTAFVNAQHLARRQMRDVVAATLEWLWNAAIAPLLPSLQAASRAYDTGPRPRIWWCPTGPLTFLPVHAAGYHDRPGEAVMDYFTSSYVPTLRLLARQHQEAPDQRQEARPLVVALASTPGQPDLPCAEEEAADFRRAFPDAVSLTGPDATVAAVTKALQGSPRLAHFACHGHHDLTDPSAGFLALHDGKLQFSALSRLSLERGELAFLSACHTNASSTSVPDEAITLATAFKMAGYNDVIGTLWSIPDRLARRIAGDVYEAILTTSSTGMGHLSPAIALDVAIRRIKQNSAYGPWAWASYVHIGP